MGIIALFICAGIAPSVAVDTIKKSSIPISKGNILYVGGTGEGNYTCIQTAIWSASDGDTVFVYDDSSPYKEHIVVDKSINLIGENTNTTIIDGRNRGNVINISADRVTVSGFTIKNGYSYGIHINSSYNTIIHNIISNNKFGILFHFASNNTIMGNIISKNIKGINMLGYNSGHTILKNNFIFNIKNVYFVYMGGLNYFPPSIKWSRNYWGRPRILPKLLFGTIVIFIPGGDLPFIFFPLPWINIDWRPALLPYDIEVVI